MRGDTTLFSGFAGGVNLVDDYEIDADQARDLRNVVCNQEGVIRKRGGVSLEFTDALNYKDSLYADPDFFYLTQRNGRIAILAGGAATALVTTGISTTARWEWAGGPISGSAYGLNGVNTPRHVIGSPASIATWTLTGGPPSPQFAKYPFYFNNRMYVTYDGSVYASKVNTATIFTPPDGWSVGIGGVDTELTGIGSIGPYVLVFSRDRTWLIYDEATGANRVLSDKVGCVAHRSIVSTPQGTFWMGIDGIYKTNGQTVERVSQPIQPAVTGLGNALNNVTAIYFDNHVYFSLPETSVTTAPNTLTLDYDTTLGTWWMHDVGAQQFAIVPGGMTLYGIQDGRIGLFNLNNAVASGDFGTPFTSYWHSPWHSFGAPYVNKRLRRIHTDMMGTADVGLFKDYAGFASTKINAAGLTGIASPYVAHSPGVGRAFSLSFGNSSTNFWGMKSYSLSLTPRRN